ncbi:sn-glycerol-3-phosphate acyltransferase 1, chloroplastic [Seminavis robusta]|uniref:Sn-glycerol-3-phosphate acyltransferase 1, chloroplastic n=1 Tax=Seminavis robusta TaxID=568900 RepID=A0A9N8F1M8_9STRA|nr:sn-glycerol-3-phosphate acyltransferase 1, chloroplastic [Seminavis robusta]|eukprot:Sro2627_g332980.1 sn-glycerol-3-phosphate acyltransferase 1, chloroplastic (314) ;mRNA; r:7106-8047
MDPLSVLKMAIQFILGFFALATVVSSLVAALQERKIWAPANMPSLSPFAMVKVFLFNIVWITSSAVGCTIIWIKYFLLFGTPDIVKECNVWVEKTGSYLCCGMLGKVTVIGVENLPPEDLSVPAPVYIANHASQIDLGAVYFIHRRFKWIAKQSVLYVPGVGLIMYTGDHVLINRVKGKNKKSVSTLFEKSDASVQSGIPMFLFPQGTRVMAKRLPFKEGAFVIAQNNKSTIVPISIDIPMNVWETWYPLIRTTVPEIKLTVHKPIKVTGQEDRQELKKQCFEQIYSCLPPIWEREEEETTTTKEATDSKKDK